MNSLPHELHIAIASHLSSPIDLSNYRLTNKRSALIGAEFLFQTFPCSPSPSTLKRMKNILASPHVRHVDTIAYSGLLPSTTEHVNDISPRTLATVVRGFGLRVKHLRASHASLLSFWRFRGAADDAFLEACKNLVTLDLEFEGLGHDRMSGLRRLLMGLDGLENLRLDFRRERLWGGLLGYDLSGVLPVLRVWGNLRRFEAARMNVQEKNIVELLRNHRTTLECVNLVYIALHVKYEADRGMEWRNIFGVLGEVEKLDEGKVIIKVDDEKNGDVVAWKLRTCGEREVEIRTNLTSYLDGTGG